MIQIKKTILTLVALLAVTTGAWATDVITVTWSSGDTYENNNSKDGVTLSGDIVRYFLEEWQLAYDKSKGTFTTELGNFTKIEITGGYINGFSGEGWSGRTWTGNAAAVPFGGYITDDSGEKPWTITFTIEPAAAPAASGPEVAWDKAEKTGKFTMPGGNVTLEPEYYPQAAVADGGVTAADADARATTDDPLVKVDATKLTGAKKLMYFVSNSGTAPAYDAEGWTDQLPTAEGFTQQGIVYVWYYPVGTDEGVDGATATYSDGDILATNALTVTIAAEPLWNAEFDLTDAPEEDKAGKWSTDIPEGGVVKGTPVTVTYTGSKKVIGVKAEKKAAAGIVNPVVGQIIGSDGKNYDANATLPSGVTAVAKIAYVGNDAETSTTYNHGLALALGDVSDKKAWCSQYQKTCLTTQYGSADAAKGDMAGIANTDALVNHTGHSHAAASAARDYNGGTHPMGTSEWFLPSAGQWDKMASAAGGYVKLRTNAGLQSDYYWSSTERDASYAWYFSSHNGDWLKDYKDMYSHRVRACLAF